MSARADGMLAGREASKLLLVALQKLSPELRETVILRDLEELEYREIAKILNVPEGTVKSRRNRGCAELRVEKDLRGNAEILGVDRMVPGLLSVKFRRPKVHRPPKRRPAVQWAAV